VGAGYFFFCDKLFGCWRGGGGGKGGEFGGGPFF